MYTDWKGLPLITSVFLIVGRHKDKHAHPELTTGKQMFEFHCSSCHKQEGNGYFLNGYHAIHNTELFSWQISHKICAEESENRNMPSFKNMLISEANLIAKFLKTPKNQ
jgi:mono/diheme cytochrome c family protein